ncbi:MAG TPA: hypothetical protein VF821_14260 [Lentzea sp.]
MLMLLRTTAVVAALAAAVLTSVGTASASPEAASACKVASSAKELGSTVDPKSNLRASPRLNGTIECTTDRKLGMGIDCWTHGDFFNDGQTATDVWYHGYVGWENPFGYVWGGNVNTTQDPPPGLKQCGT